MRLFLVVNLILMLYQVSRADECPFCKKLAEEHCLYPDGSPKPLCNKIANKACPTNLLRASRPDLPLHLQEPNDIIQDKMQSVKCDKDEYDDGIMDLLEDILQVVHRSTKANIKRAKKKDLKRKLAIKNQNYNY